MRELENPSNMYGSYRKFMSNTIIIFVVRQVHSPLKSELSTERDLVLTLPVSFIFQLHQGHPVAAYVLFLVFPSFLSFLTHFLQ